MRVHSDPWREGNARHKVHNSEGQMNLMNLLGDDPENKKIYFFLEGSQILSPKQVHKFIRFMAPTQVHQVHN